MNSLADVFPEVQVGPGADLYHYSGEPDRLVDEGYFDLSMARRGPAVFFGDQQTAEANISVPVERDLWLVNSTDTRKLLAFIKREMGARAGRREFIGMLAASPYDGFISDGFDTMTQLQSVLLGPFQERDEAEVCSEIALVRSGLEKLGTITRITPKVILHV